MTSASNVKPLIYAHRGTTLQAPENTRPAFELCLAQGADILEIDVRISRDEHVVVTHDATLERTTDGRGSVLDHTLEELKKLDASARFTAPDISDLELTDNPGLPAVSSDEKVGLLTLDELFALYPSTRINIDIKDPTEQAARLVAKSIANAKRASTTTVGSFHRVPLVHFRQLIPEVRTAALRDEVANLYFRYLAGRAPPVFTRGTAGGHPLLPYGVLQIPVSYFKIPLATRGFVDYVQNIGLELTFWTLNDVDSITRIMALGVDGIVTDRTDLAVEVRKNHQPGL